MADKLKCTQCGHENEAERIYCHNCGTKLDRSVLPVEEKKKESNEQTMKRVRKMTNPNTGFFAGAGKSLLKSLLWAVAVAGAVQIARPPDGIPPKAGADTLLDAQPLLMSLQNAQMQRAPARLAMDETLINKYLQATLKEQATGLIGDEVKFNRVFVHCVDGNPQGSCWITSEQALFDYHLFASVGYELSIANNQVKTKCVGGYLGRLPVHPLLMQYGDLIFSKIWDALGREHKVMNQMQSIEVHKGQIVVTTKPAA
ncbi:MAG: zinc ribbon domain-containing protein [Chthoniobacteraceae bacterium]